MLPNRDADAARLWDILEHAKHIARAIAGKSEHDYLNDRIAQLIVERSLEIIGVAAQNITVEVRAQYPEIPWQKVISQRNAIAHEYGEIKQERLWNVAKVRVPLLVTQVETILKTMPLPSMDESTE